MEAGKGEIQFPHEFGVYRTVDENTKEADVCFEEIVRPHGLYPERALRIREPIRHGSWSGRGDAVFFAGNIVVADKNPAVTQTRLLLAVLVAAFLVRGFAFFSFDYPTGADYGHHTLFADLYLDEGPFFLRLFRIISSARLARQCYQGVRFIYAAFAADDGDGPRSRWQLSRTCS